MSICIPKSLGTRFTNILHSYAQDEGLPFASVLTEEQIQRGIKGGQVSLFSSKRPDPFDLSIRRGPEFASLACRREGMSQNASNCPSKK